MSRALKLGAAVTVSLPYVWVVGHIAALLGAFLLISQTFFRVPGAIVAGFFGALGSCLILAYLLNEIGVGFLGSYAYMSWVIAALAGYAVSSPFGYVAAWLAERRERGLAASRRSGDRAERPTDDLGRSSLIS